MPEETETQEITYPRYNAYKCTECGGIYMTRDLDPGTTPFFMTCFVKQWCGGQARSLMYPTGDMTQAAEMYPLVVEFYKPTRKEIRKTKNPMLKEHFLKGGLKRRIVEDAPDWVKAVVGNVR